MRYSIVFAFEDRKDILHSEGDDYGAMMDTLQSMRRFIRNGGQYQYLNAWPVLRDNERRHERVH